MISEVTLTGNASGYRRSWETLRFPPAVLTALAFMLTSVAILVPSLTQLTLFHLPALPKVPETMLVVTTAAAVIGIVVAAALRVVIVGEDGGDILPYATFTQRC